jgi:hypothetical protein
VVARGPKPKSLDAAKRCNKCHVVRAAECFRIVHYTREDGTRGETREAYCKECLSAQQKSDRPRRRAYEKKYADANRTTRRKASNRWYAENKARVREQRKQFRNAHPEIVRPRYIAAIYQKRVNGFDRRRKDIRNAIADCLDAHRIGEQYWDVYGSCLITSPTIDHVQPLALGGTNAAENLCVTSLDANSSKNDDILIVWLAKRARQSRNS